GGLPAPPYGSASLRKSIQDGRANFATVGRGFAPLPQYLQQVRRESQKPVREQCCACLHFHRKQRRELQTHARARYYARWPSAKTPTAATAPAACGSGACCRDISLPFFSSLRMISYRPS